MGKHIKNFKYKARKYFDEYIKCQNSFEYFCPRYVKLEMPGKDIAFIPYDKQLELIETLEVKKNVIVLKSRQIGISTITQAFIAWLTVFHENVVVGIISKDGKEATDFARTVRGMIEKLPLWMLPKNKNKNKKTNTKINEEATPGFNKKSEQSFILKNGSKVYVSTVNPQAPEKCLRGKAITFLVIDEAAFIGKLDDAWTSMVPALATNQKHAKENGVPYGTIILSTPNKTVGIGKWFFQQYTNAINDIDSNKYFTYFKIHWRDIPQLADSPDWYKQQCLAFNNDPAKIKQELELQFLPAGGAFFDGETCQKLQEVSIEPVETLKLFNGEAWRFADPDKGRHYIIGVDTAPEHGLDRSALTVWDYETLNQVWEFQGKLSVTDYIKVIKLAAAIFPGTIVVESNSYGNQILEDLRLSDYSHMLYYETRGELGKKVPGISTNIKTRPLMIDALYSYISHFPEGVKSTRLALELVGLVSKTSGRVEADIGMHDDLALSTALAFYVRKYDPPLNIELSKNGNSYALDNFKEILDLNNPYKIQSPKLEHIKEYMDDNDIKGGLIDIMQFFNK